MSPSTEILILASMVAASCALPGVFLILRRSALMSDAISHAILFGIVVAFFVTKSLTSIWLIIAAALTGVLTVTLTEALVKTRKLKQDAAIGLVFPVLFSLGVILISKYARHIHLDSDCVLFGEIAFAPFNRFMWNGQDLGPIGFWVVGIVLLINTLFVALFYKELKISTFDPQLAAALGFAPWLIQYLLMFLVSLTCVATFEHVGSILVVALMIVPPAAAYLLTNDLFKMVLLSVGIGVGCAIGGYGLAQALNTNISGAMAVVNGLVFLAVLCFSPQRGLWSKWIMHARMKWDLPVETLTVHLFQVESLQLSRTEAIVSHMKNHMLWEDRFTREVIAQALKEGLIDKQLDHLTLTPLGMERAKEILGRG